MTRSLGLTRITLKSMHLLLNASDEQLKAMAAKVREAGLDLYGAGVIYMKNETQVKEAFHYAQIAGLKVIVGVPLPNGLSVQIYLVQISAQLYLKKGTTCHV